MDDCWRKAGLVLAGRGAAETGGGPSLVDILVRSPIVAEPRVGPGGLSVLQEEGKENGRVSRSAWG